MEEASLKDDQKQPNTLVLIHVVRFSAVQEPHRSLIRRDASPIRSGEVTSTDFDKDAKETEKPAPPS
jgi:hypothetical protein